MKERPVCDDCGDEVPKGRRRTRARCGAMVCSYCLHHVHGWQCGGRGVYRKTGADPTDAHEEPR